MSTADHEVVCREIEIVLGANDILDPVLEFPFSLDRLPWLSFRIDESRECIRLGQFAKELSCSQQVELVDIGLQVYIERSSVEFFEIVCAEPPFENVYVHCGSIFGYAFGSFDAIWIEPRENDFCRGTMQGCHDIFRANARCEAQEHLVTWAQAASDIYGTLTSPASFAPKLPRVNQTTDRVKTGQ